MIAHLLNDQIINHEPTYHQNLEKLFGIKVIKVRSVDTAERTCLITINYPSKAILLRVLNYLRSQGVVVRLVEENYEVDQLSQMDALSSFADTARIHMPHKHKIKSNQYFDDIFHLMGLKAFLLQSELKKNDHEFLADLSDQGIFLNHWDTSQKNEKLWSICLPTGRDISKFSTIAQKHELICEPAWKNDYLWERMINSLQSNLKIDNRKYGLTDHDLEEAFEEVQLFTLEELTKYSHALNEGRTLNLNRLAGILGNFYLKIENNLKDRSTKARKYILPSINEPEIEFLAQGSIFYNKPVEPVDVVIDQNEAERATTCFGPWYQSLSSEEQMALVLRKNGASMKEIARATNTSYGAAKVRFFRTMKKLRQKMDNLGIERTPAVDMAICDFLDAQYA